MLVKVEDLSPELQQEFMGLVDMYKNDGKLRQTLLYSCHQDHLMSAKKHTDYEAMRAQRYKTLSQFTFHEYASVHNGQILGIMYFMTVNMEGKIVGTEMFTWRVAEKPSFMFGSDLNKIRMLYEAGCHECTETVIYGQPTIDYEKIHGPVFLTKYPDAVYVANEVRCRDRVIRPQLTCVRIGKLC